MSNRIIMNGAVGIEQTVKINTCKDCGFFKPHQKRDYDYNTYLETFTPTDFGECQSGKILYDDPDNWRRLDKDWNPVPLTTDILCYQDGEDYHAFHLVGKDFGCIHFQEKGSQSDEKSYNPPTN